MLINELKITKKKKKKRIGRGGAHGTYSTRGGKGQTARSGSSFRIGFEGGRSPLKKQLPKIGGFKSHKEKPATITLQAIEKHFSDGAIISPDTLAGKNITKQRKVKIVNTGELTKKLTVRRCLVSESAKKKIEEKGGSVK
ncbi:MAG: 50S ribosomal protein L15 [bacterium]